MHRRHHFSAVLLTLAISGCLGGGDGGSGDSAAEARVPPSNSTADQPIPPGEAPPAQPTSRADAMRFLEQSSFGPMPAAIDQVMQKGAPLALEEQFYKGMSGYPQYFWADTDSGKACPEGSAQTCYRDTYTPFLMQMQFFRNAIAGGDQLRQRVAFALGQILVVSGTSIPSNYGLQRYHQMLMNRAFGNFRDILQDVTLSPAMGEYLDMVNNPKPNPSRGISPNENYARELLQLFSIGEVRLNPDGTPQLDAAGKTIPTYDQDVILALSRALTGWTYPTLPGATRRFYNPRNYEGPMEPVESQHDTGAKTILEGRVIPAGQSAAKDVSDALDIIFAHQNVGPFIGRQLIQHLVTANPSPQYVGRVTAAFNSNGRGVRGDMRAVLRAILLDPEARGAAKTATDYGKLREPALFVTGMLRALEGQSDGVYPLQQARAMGQDVFSAPSVFSFIRPTTRCPARRSKARRSRSCRPARSSRAPSSRTRCCSRRTASRAIRRSATHSARA